MHEPALWIVGHDLEREGVACHGREMVVPEEAERLIALREAYSRDGPGGKSRASVLIQAEVPRDPARAHQQDIAWLDRHTLRRWLPPAGPRH